jgi:hypothetical protein
MEEYKPNSHKSKEQKEKKIEKVVTGAVRTKKKSEVRKLADIFISEDISNVKSYIFMDVLIPAVKKAIDDIVSNGIHMLLYNGDKRNEKHSSVSKVSYSGFYRGSNDRTDRRTDRTRAGFDYDDIIFDNRGDAEAVLSAMDDIIERYGVVSVLDLFDLAEVSTTNYAAQRYGWTDIQSAHVARTSDGYMIKLPRALPIN